MPEADADVGGWERHLSAPFHDRQVICAFEVLAGMTTMVQSLRRWGARRPLLIADSRGTGPVPSEDEADIVMLETPRFDSLTEQVRARMRPEARLTPDIVNAVDAYDPNRNAAWWMSPLSPNTPMLGRPVFGGRPPSQTELEDKLLVDALLAAVGAPHQPGLVVPTSYDDLSAASATVAAETTPAGAKGQVVWAGDASHGINGGGDYIRWIRSPEQAAAAATFFSRRCDKVRVSPFLEGVPCSMHGIVLPDGVVVLRPMELASLRDLLGGRFVYAGLGTTWDPPSDDAREMRDLTRRIGLHLQRSKGYRGGFSIDGVLTTDGFRVTELNPRFSGGLGRFARYAPELQLELVHLNALLGRDIHRPSADLEAEAVARFDEDRFCEVLGLSTQHLADDGVAVPVTASDRSLEVADLDDQIIGTVNVGPSPLGAFVRLTLLDGFRPPDARAAELGVMLYEFADRMWDTGFGELLIAPDVRN